VCLPISFDPCDFELASQSLTPSAVWNDLDCDDDGINNGEEIAQSSDPLDPCSPISCELNIPEGFSPNGDGVNDLYVIRGIKNYPLNEFKVFNRWGNLVYSAKPYDNTWDGRATHGLVIGGEVLPTGVYFYILDFGDGNKPVKGSIYINKEN
jgi:gliding motility-associated-like protein